MKRGQQQVRVTPPITLTIAAADRYWVAEALIDLALSIERDAAERRKGSPGADRQFERAGRLRDLARRVMI